MRRIMTDQKNPSRSIAFFYIRGEMKWNYSRGERRKGNSDIKPNFSGKRQRQARGKFRTRRQGIAQGRWSKRYEKSRARGVDEVPAAYRSTRIDDRHAENTGNPQRRVWNTTI